MKRYEKLKTAAKALLLAGDVDRYLQALRLMHGLRAQRRWGWPEHERDATGTRAAMVPGFGEGAAVPGRVPPPPFQGGDPFRGIAVEGPMTKKDKIAFIKSSKRKTHVYNDLSRYSDQQLDSVIREIVQGLIRESEIIANAYINGYR